MNKEKHSKEVVEIANTIVNECGNAPCKECMWCDAATWAHAEALYNAGYRKQEWISVTIGCLIITRFVLFIQQKIIAVQIINITDFAYLMSPIGCLFPKLRR